MSRKDYTREETATAEATSQSPLNRLVDAVSPESDAARHFSELVDKFLAGSCRDAALYGKLRARLSGWKENDAVLSQLAQNSFLVKEVAGTSRDLSSIGAIGLTALEAIASAQPLSADQQTELNSALSGAAKPRTQILLMPVGAVQKLLAAASQPSPCARK